MDMKKTLIPGITPGQSLTTLCAARDSNPRIKRHELEARAGWLAWTSLTLTLVTDRRCAGRLLSSLKGRGRSRPTVLSL
jgi:hypothetical protein